MIDPADEGKGLDRAFPECREKHRPTLLCLKIAEKKETDDACSQYESVAANS